MTIVLPVLPRLLTVASCWLLASCLIAADIRTLTPDSEPNIAGKEVDWIYGDYLLSNDQVSAIIAAPLPTRDANLTVRQIGASLLDLTLNSPSNDQLSAFIPTCGRYLFHDPELVEMGHDGTAVYWQCQSTKSLAGDETIATVRYQLEDSADHLEATITIAGAQSTKIRPFDGIRADGPFSFQTTPTHAYCSDAFFRQAIGFRTPSAPTQLRWKKDRPYELHYSNEHLTLTDDSLSWTVALYPATSPLDLSTVIDYPDQSHAMIRFDARSPWKKPVGADGVMRAKIQIRSSTSDQAGNQTEPFTLHTDDQGIAYSRLISGKYVASVSAIGFSSLDVPFEVKDEQQTVHLPLSNPSGLVGRATDENGESIPMKATIYRIDGPHPDFGPNSTRTLVRNCVYSVHGHFQCGLDPGQYEIWFSHGPEYNSATKTIEIVANQIAEVAVKLRRVVDTTGWVSTELHSHSSPSGDNTSDQFGRVENLLCEHLEFAPCTEHNRVSSYTPHLETMKMTRAMATCTGIELTGSPLPANHQNAFPLHHHPHTQNGGGPTVDKNPVVQIERLAMWDNGSDKLVQMNHPNLHQVYGDLDVNGIADQGFRGMLKWMDVIEVHPLETIFEDVASSPPNVRQMRIPMFQWMQLLNQGFRIPGVVNTDAHYNHHGSGWLRNWFASSTDDPAKISTEEMVEQAEAGHIIMSNGPFLKVSAQSSQTERPAIPGDVLVATDAKVDLSIEVQCPNWLDINRVQLLINGRPSKKHNLTRKNSADLFGDVDAVVKFRATLPLQLPQDAHLIVATIGEGMTMEKVMGDDQGKRAPIAVSNPIFVDVDGNGFEANGDELGLPLPRMQD